MKSPDEIKLGLECCYGDKEKRLCDSCPNSAKIEGYTELICLDFDSIGEDALAYIQQLERERDAAVACIPHACGYCKHFIITHNGCTPDYDCARSGCTNISGVNTGWEWRGVQNDG